MKSPIHHENAQEAANGRSVACMMVAEAPSAPNSNSQDRELTRTRPSNSVFRYPSPSGWSGGVSTGSPVFSRFDAPRLLARRVSAAMGVSRLSCWHLLKILPKSPKLGRQALKATSLCDISNSRRLPSVPLQRYLPVVTTLANKPSLVVPQAPSLPKSLAAMPALAHSLAARPMCFSVKKTQENVANSNSLAGSRLMSEIKTIGARVAAMVFLLSLSAGLPVGQEPEGT